MSYITRIVAIICVVLGTVSHSSAGWADSPLPYTLNDSLFLPGATRWDYLTFDQDHHRLFITRGDSVDILDVAGKKITGSITELAGVHGVALAPDLNKGFISEGKANRVAVFDLTTLKVLTTAPTGEKPDAVVYDQATQRIFAADGESDDLTVIDAKSNTVLGKIALNGAPEFAVVDGAGQLYVNLEDKSQIAVVDTAMLKVVTNYNLAPGCDSPTGLAIDSTHNLLFSVCANKTMMIVDSGSGKILDTLPIGEHSDAAIFDPTTRLVFSSNGDGTLTIAGLDIDGHYRILQTVQTKVTARTMALDPTTHAVYLAAARTEGFEPPTDKHPEPRPHVKQGTFMILRVDNTP
jgi:YVTN family beta-propeller protein